MATSLYWSSFEEVLTSGPRILCSEHRIARGLDSHLGHKTCPKILRSLFLCRRRTGVFGRPRCWQLPFISSFICFFALSCLWGCQGHRHAVISGFLINFFSLGCLWGCQGPDAAVFNVFYFFVFATLWFARGSYDGRELRHDPSLHVLGGHLSAFAVKGGRIGRPCPMCRCPSTELPQRHLGLSVCALPSSPGTFIHWRRRRYRRLGLRRNNTGLLHLPPLRWAEAGLSHLHSPSAEPHEGGHSTGPPQTFHQPPPRTRFGSVPICPGYLAFVF